ncbi:helix-turn-helix domain-containing protein [Stomatohabitans albus]|uniref:TetR/AcrR family transcriptional regulator n=1 Tax=Stomatohabitans albus TaxID=3110766 RepID=UPI00300C096F
MVDFPRARVAKQRKSHAQKKNETQQALLLAALDIFSREGYHRATLDAIADIAGYSKGAIYANYSNKAELFLAVMEFLNDDDCEQIVQEHVDEHEFEGLETDDDIRSYAKGLVEGIGLASLEFMTVAIRDESLKKRLAQRMSDNIEIVIPDVQEWRSDRDPLTDKQIAYLMGAFELGFNVLALLGVPDIHTTLNEVGLARLANPRQAADQPIPKGLELPMMTQVEQIEAFIRSYLGR